MAKRKSTKGKQLSTKHTHKTKEWAIQTGANNILYREITIEQII
jgi:hypothetical protein